MSTKPAPTEPDIKPETVLVARGASGRCPALHLSGEDGTPICDTVLSDKTDQAGYASGPKAADDRWTEKDMAVYPEGWRNWCGSCLRKLEEEPTIPVSTSEVGR